LLLGTAYLDDRLTTDELLLGASRVAVEVDYPDDTDLRHLYSRADEWSGGWGRPPTELEAEVVAHASNVCARNNRPNPAVVRAISE
jgi:hypothetical protein